MLEVKIRFFDRAGKIRFPATEREKIDVPDGWKLIYLYKVSEMTFIISEWGRIWLIWSQAIWFLIEIRKFRIQFFVATNSGENDAKTDTWAEFLIMWKNKGRKSFCPAVILVTLLRAQRLGVKSTAEIRMFKNSQIDDWQHAQGMFEAVCRWPALDSF